nr:putative ribonuclease H-like domain-containing protein [Tanacetum cinerariifolium]
DVMLRDNALVELRKKFEAAEKERDKLKLTLENFHTSSKNLSKLIESQISDKTGLGYDNQMFKSTVFNCDELNSYESDVSVPTSLVYDSETVFNVEPSITKPTKEMSPTNRPSCNPQQALKDKGVIDSGFSRHMTGNISYLSDFEEINEGYVAFGENRKGGKITGKGKIRTSKLDFDDVYFFKKRKFNLFSVLQICDKKNSVLFTDTECVVLSSNFKLPDENQVLLRVSRENNMYNVDLKNIVPSRDLTCLFTKATLDESNLWHRRLGHINFKTMNKLVKGNLVRGLPSKVFENNHTCVACKKGKQHRASCKTKPISSISQPLQRLHMDLFGPTFVKSLNKRSYCLVVTDDYNRFSLVFFLAIKDETSPILKTFIIGIENQINHKVKIIRSDNGTEFKNHDLNHFCGMKGIKREFSIARTPQQNGVAEKKNRTLIEAARTMLADLLLPIPFWAEVVNTAWNKPNSSAGIQDNFDAGKVGKEPVSTQQYVLLPLWSTSSKDPQNTDADAALDDKQNESKVHVSPGSGNKTKKHDEKEKREAKGKSLVELSTGVRDLSDEFEEFSVNSTKRVNAASAPVTASSFVDPSQYPDDLDMLALGDIIYSDDQEDVDADANFSNLERSITVSPILTTRVHKDHRVTQIIGDLSLAPQTRSMTRVVKDQEPKRVHQALKDPSWIEAMQEELLQFKMQKEEGIDYEEVFALVARTEAIRLFLAYASFMGFMVYQMDVKSALFYGTIKEEVYFCQPLGFKDPNYIDKVYKEVKALYGLHYALRAWYETLANYLLENGFQRGKIYQTLFIKKQKGDILLVQVYVDDIIFGSTNKELCTAFEKLMKDKFQMSSMRELTFFKITNGKLSSTPIDTEKPLLKDTDVDDLSAYNTKYTSPALTQKVFANMRRIGKVFSGVDTPLFDGMLVPQQVQDVKDAVDDEDNDHEVSADPTPPLPTPATPSPSHTQEHIPSPPQAQPAPPSSLPPPQPSQTTDISMTLLNTLGGCQSQAKVYHLDLQHGEKVLSMQDTDEAQPAEVEEVIEVVTAAKLMTKDEAFARELEAELNANISWNDVMEQVKRKEKQDNTVMRYQALKRKPEEEGSNRNGEDLKQDAAKKQRIDEEVEELKTHLQIIANDDDDVYTEATPLAFKVPVVDYRIHHENNKPYYKIIRVDGIHQLFLSFITLLNKFDREDLEMLWKLVQERFQSSEPKNFSDDFMLNTLKTMFEKPNVEASIWRDQRGIYGLAKVKS